MLLAKVGQFVKELRAGGPALNPSSVSAASAAAEGVAKVKLTSARPEEATGAAPKVRAPARGCLRSHTQVRRIGGADLSFGDCMCFPHSGSRSNTCTRCSRVHPVIPP